MAVMGSNCSVCNKLVGGTCEPPAEYVEGKVYCHTCARRKGVGFYKFLNELKLRGNKKWF